MNSVLSFARPTSSFAPTFIFIRSRSLARVPPPSLDVYSNEHITQYGFALARISPGGAVSLGLPISPREREKTSTHRKHNYMASRQILFIVESGVGGALALRELASEAERAARARCQRK